MKANDKFIGMPKSFWASVRSLSQEIGYSRKDKIVVPSLDQMALAFDTLGLDKTKIKQNGMPTALANDLLEYFELRSQQLEKYVQPRLMDVDRARTEFQQLYAKLQPKCPIPMNKQKGTMKAEAYLTGIVNMLIDANADGLACDFDPRQLTTITWNGEPLRTLARRVDGAFPSTVDPVAIWEIKEYYYTTTFGSRVADGVYETLLDGLELEELRDNEKIDVKHYLMIDAHYTWWVCGKSYLCRIFDMLHMGYVDEVLFGYEVIEQMPRIVGEWKKLLNRHG